MAWSATDPVCMSTYNILANVLQEFEPADLPIADDDTPKYEVQNFTSYPGAADPDLLNDWVVSESVRFIGNLQVDPTLKLKSGVQGPVLYASVETVFAAATGTVGALSDAASNYYLQAPGA